MSFLYLGEEVLRQLEALRRRIEKKTLKKEEFRKVKEEEKNWPKKEITRGKFQYRKPRRAQKAFDPRPPPPSIKRATWDPNFSFTMDTMTLETRT